MRGFFNPLVELSSVSLKLRPLSGGDLEALYEAASAPEVWAGHPATDRFKRSVFEPYAMALIDSGSTLVVIDPQSDCIIGCSRYYVPPDQPDGISIGFTFLHQRYWGGATNFELKRLMLEHAFQSFSEVWFHISPTNIRSQRATRKLGAKYIGDAVLDLSGTPAEFMCFRLSKDDWELTCNDRACLTASRS